MSDMSDTRTPAFIKYCYSFVVMMIFYSLPTLDSVELVTNQSSLPTQASSNTTTLPTLRPSLFLAPIPSLLPTIVTTTSSPIVATTTSSPTSLSPTLSPTVSSPPTVTPSSSPACLDENDNCALWASVDECEKNPVYMLKLCRKSCGSCKPQLENNSEPILSPSLSFSTCSDTCGSERELVDNNNIKGQIVKYIDEGKMKNIDCLDTSNITNMNYLLYGYSDNRFRSFNEDLSCWDVSSVTSMDVST